MQLDARELSVMCELVGVASLCSWTVCLAVGLGLCSPDRALLMGLPGTLLGSLWFEMLGWPAGPTLDGYPILPALVGTTFVLAVTAYVARLREELRSEPQEDPLRRFRKWSDAPEPTAPAEARRPPR